MEMRKLERLKEMLCDELDDIVEKGELSAGSLETAHKLTDTIKNIYKICMLDEDGEHSQRRGGDRYSRNRDMYSRAGDWEARGRFGDRSYDDDGNSYRHRDRMGRYSRDDGAKEMIGELEEMLPEFTGEKKEILKRAIRELKNA